ncbi:uncharacterized protein MELLADRAFT_65234 [Melampsora larici-populina 98AG31]|uniref:Uncharacterized protein n=1 Tax=Melampsora larici-populina (strain 98AG31 / pathotype 3-4-7) TaxID=747676 RepID=F4RUI6_MELLP|nr:uncharacterized protein MELLADRAFT_65234 [Melampsora larici-populina 98AG31]EGG03993.1 hypothetical protein MELLADRAFT_65234 [Melampsora larici-populina 98AG31]
MEDTPSTSIPKPSRRSLRKNLLRIVRVDNEEQSVGKDKVEKKTEKSKKRKKANKVVLGKRYLTFEIRSSKSLTSYLQEHTNDPATDGPIIDTLTGQADVPVGSSTSREKLLDLLSRRFNPKKPRLSMSNDKKTSRRQTAPKSTEKKTDTPSSQMTAHPQSQFDHLKNFELNYSGLPDSQLVGMLHNIGLDTRGMNTEQLINSCKVHQDLLELPEFYVSEHRSSSMEQHHMMLPGPSASDPQSAPFETLHRHEMEDSAALADVLPSHPQLNCPLQQLEDQAVPARSSKGKEKEVYDREDAGIFEDDDTPFQALDHQNTSTWTPHPNFTTEDPGAWGTEGQNIPTGDSEPINLASLTSIITQQTITIAQLNSALEETNKRVKDLEDEVHRLSSVVQKLLSERGTDPSETSTCGGRIAARMRFHIETLLGQKSGEKILPKAASAEDKKAWMSQQAIDEFEFYDVHLSPSDRFSQEKWDNARKLKAANEVRRTSRLRHLKTLRDRVVLAEKTLWPLANIIQHVCSDDETDNESEGPPSQSPLMVRRLEWRSAELQLHSGFLAWPKGPPPSKTHSKGRWAYE